MEPAKLELYMYMYNRYVAPLHSRHRVGTSTYSCSYGVQ